LKIRKLYVRPELFVTGDIASLTEAPGGGRGRKGPGSGDAFLLDVPASGAVANTS
jgi:hypothetical protein